MLGALVFLILVQAASALVQEAQVKPDLAAATRALEAEKYADAAAILEKLLAAEPRDYRLRFNLAFAYSQLKRDREAIEQYSKVVQEQTDLVPARLNLGILLLRQKDPAAAVLHLEVAAAKKPQDFRARFYLAEALLGSGQVDRAVESYRQALELDPRSAAAAAGLGRGLARAGRIDEAKAEFLRATQLDPAFRDSLLELGDLLEQKQQAAQAVELYLEFLKGTSDPGATENLAVRERAGVLLLGLKRYPEAVEQLETAVKQNPTAANQAALAQAYTMNRQPDKALPLLRGAVAAEPSSGELHFRLATALLEAHDPAGAAREFAAVLDKEPQKVEAWNGLAFASYKTENFPIALKALDRARALGPEPAGNHFLRAIILDKFHQYPEALESYQKFLAADGGRDPDDEFKARQRVRIITNLLNKRR